MYISSNLFELHDEPNIPPPPFVKLARQKASFTLPAELLGKRKRVNATTDEPVSKKQPSDAHRLVKSPRYAVSSTASETNNEASFPDKQAASQPELDDLCRQYAQENHRIANPPQEQSLLSLSAPQTARSRRKFLSPRQRRKALSEHATTTWSSSKGNSRPPSLLRPCHICHKAPKQKTDLDAYTNCRSCQERTCYICIRQCEAECGERAVCSSCCVETGEDGWVSCLECFDRQTGDHDMTD